MKNKKKSYDESSYIMSVDILYHTSIQGISFCVLYLK